MGEQLEDQIGDVDMSSSEVTFDNLTILREIGNIVDLVRNEDFLETVPKAKLRRVKWVPMFNCLKQGILDEMLQELTSMWEYENMPHKLEALEKQKEKFEEAHSGEVLWRPQLGDVSAQLKAADAANLKKQKVMLELLAKDYETNVNKLKKTVSARRGYLKALQLDIQKYQKKYEDIVSSTNVRIENHQNITRMMIAPNRVDAEDIIWTEKDLHINE